MEKKVIPFHGTRTRKRVVTLFATLLLFGFLNLVFVNFVGVPFSLVAITGYAVVNDSGVVQILIEQLPNVYIYSPGNTTYNFDQGDPYIIELNVSADFSVEPVDGWKYSLYDLRHDVYVEQNTLFTPNSSINVTRWGNLLTVSALSDEERWISAGVIFYVNVSNSAPILGNTSDPIFVCEGESLSYRFNATDVDEEALIGDISPKNPFYLSSQGTVGNISFFDIISGILDKDDVGTYTESISAKDPWDVLDSRDVDIEVIEINNLPVLENIGAQTVWLTGSESNFYYVVDVIDVEEGDLEFNLTWAGGEDLFDVGVNSGIMNYTPSVGHEGRVYNLEVCVEDSALDSIHENISLCSPRGGDTESVCDDFTLTVTDGNRAPEILDYTPVDNLISVSGTQNVEYFAEVFDADGTIPDIDWYVDGVRVEHNEDVPSDSFVYAFACGVSGAHSVEVVTSDGLLNDSQEWLVSVSGVECPVESSDAGGGGGGGGGSRGAFCTENWVCDDWMVCQNVKRSFSSEMLSLEDYAVARDTCLQNKEDDERFCGFQITSCSDLNDCGREEPISPRPSEKRFCYFTEDPGCSDGITNCHDGACELLVDCGGPCSACATCSDAVQNQGEEDVDCGGPCPFSCEPEVPFAMISNVLIVIAIILVIVISWIVWRLFFLWKK